MPKINKVFCIDQEIMNSPEIKELLNKRLLSSYVNDYLKTYVNGGDETIKKKINKIKEEEEIKKISEDLTLRKQRLKIQEQKEKKEKERYITSEEARRRGIKF